MVRAQSVIGFSNTQEEAQERLLNGVMHGTVVKLAVHAKGGPLRQAVRMELRCSYSAHHIVLTSPDQQSYVSSSFAKVEADPVLVLHTVLAAKSGLANQVPVVLDKMTTESAGRTVRVASVALSGKRGLMLRLLSDPPSPPVLNQCQSQPAEMQGG